MSRNIVITGVSPVLRLILNVSDALGVTMEESYDLLEPYVSTGPDGLSMIPEDADIPPYLLRAMRGTP